MKKLNRSFLYISIWTLTFGLMADSTLKPITYEMAYKHQGPKLSRNDQKFLGWKDGSHFYWRISGKESAFLLVDASTGKQKKVNEERVPLGIKTKFRQSSQDETMTTWIQDGDLFLEDSSGVRQMTQSKAKEQNPEFSPDGKWIAFTRDNNLFAVNIASGLEVQLTGDGIDVIKNGYSSWVYYEEIFGRQSKYRAFWWSPDSKKLAFMQFDDSNVDEFQIYHLGGVNGFWEKTRYPKSGQINPSVKLGVVDLETGKIVFMPLQADNTCYLAFPVWCPDSRSLFVQWMNRDQNKIVIYDWDPENGNVATQYEEEQTAWVDFFENLTFIDDHSFVFRSNKSGYAHLYLGDRSQGNITPLTHGEWRVEEFLGYDKKNQWLYFMGNKDDHLSSRLMRVKRDSSALEIVTKAPGTHKVQLSPDFSCLVCSSSDVNNPTKMWCSNVDSSESQHLLYDTANPEGKSYQKGKREFFFIPSTDGFDLPAVWLLPPGFDISGKVKYPVIFKIYSGPDAGTVKNKFNSRTGWQDYYLAQEGVIVLAVDHRGSGFYGKKGVALMHRNLGKWELHDLVEAVKWLKTKNFIDGTKVGITGYSYGGYMTLLAMTQGADFFTHGISGAPVTDWKYYDTVYTERYMDTPEQNPDGYRYASILEHADMLKGKLLLLHGTADDNVHFQQSMELVDRLTSLDKQFELMIYPESRHGIKQRDHENEMVFGFWKREFKLP